MRRWMVAALVAVGTLAVPGTARAAVPSTPRHSVGFNDIVRAVAYSGSTAYVGGDFGYALDGNYRTTREYAAAVTSSGALSAWAPQVNGSVTAIATSGGTVYLGGSFTEVNGAPRRHLAAVRASDGALTGFHHTLGSVPDQLAVGNGRLYAVGDFGSVDNKPWPYVAAFTLPSGALDTAFHPSLDGTVQSVATAPGRVYLGGVFKQVNGSTASPRLAAVNTAGELLAGYGATDVVHGIAVTGSTVYAALGGAGGRLTAYHDGTPAWTLTADGDVHTVAVLGGTVYAGGHFDNVCTTARVAQVHGDCLDGHVSRQKLFAADADGHLLSWAPQADSTRGVVALAPNTSLGTLAAGGAFTTFGTDTEQLRFAVFG